MPQHRPHRTRAPARQPIRPPAPSTAVERAALADRLRHVLLPAITTPAVGGGPPLPELLVHARPLLRDSLRAYFFLVGPLFFASASACFAMSCRYRASSSDRKYSSRVTPSSAMSSTIVCAISRAMCWKKK